VRKHKKGGREDDVKFKNAIFYSDSTGIDENKSI
jgi:hypothetical protein